MRRPLRTVGLVVLAIAAITCTESANLTKPRATGPVQLTVSPRFSAEAARAYSGLAAFGILVTEAHVHLTAPDGSARDTVIDFPPTQAQLVVDIPVAAGLDGQPFTVLLELRNDTHVVLFSGTQIVIAHASGFNGGPPPFIDVQYTGPGRGAATVTVTPTNPTTSSSSGMSFAATAVDAAGKPVSGLLVLWTSSDITVATVTSTGDATASVSGSGKRGVATITATTPLGVFGTSRFTFVPAPARVVVMSGGGQTGVAGSTLAQPLVVEVQASDNLPVPGAPVTFRSLTTGGSVQQTTVIADANGRASTALTLGRVAGVYQFDATSGALTPASVNETATPAPAAAIAIVSGDAQSNLTGLALAQPLVVRVTDQFGGAVSGANVTWTQVTGSGVLGVAASQSDVNGLASNNYTLGSVAGTESVQASLTGVVGSTSSVAFTMTAINRVPTGIAIISGGNQSGAPGAVLQTPLVVRVTDALGNGVPNASVTWSASVNGTTFAPAASTTNASGQASTIVTLGTTPGPVQVTARVGTLSAATTLTVTGSVVAKFTVITGPPATVTVGAPIPGVQVQLVDANNIPVLQAGVSATLDIFFLPSDINIGLVATSNAAGVVTFAPSTYLNSTGTASFTVTVGTFSQQINQTPVPVVAGTATHLIVSIQPSSSASSGQVFATQPEIQFADGGNNILGQAGLSVTASIGSGGGTLGGTLTVGQGPNGNAAFTNLLITGAPGVRVLTFTSGTLSPVSSNSINVGAGAATQLVIVTQPSSTTQVGVPFSAQPVVKLLDANGNAVLQAGVNIVASILTGGGTLNGAVTAATNASGVATFTNLAITGNIGLRTLQFSSGSLTPAVSSTISVTAGPGTQLSFSTPPAPTATSGVPLAAQPVLQILDAGGNPSPAAGVTVTATIATGTGTLTNATATTNASGAATFSGLTITGPAGNVTLQFAAAGYAPTVSGVIAVGAAPATHLAFVTPPSTTASNGVPFAIQPVVQLRDASNNPVATAGIAISASITSGTGGLNQAAAFTDATGTATFTTEFILGTAGIFNIQFTSGTLPALPFGPITLTAGPATQLILATQPSPAAQVGVPFTTQPVVQIADQSGNAVSQAGASVSASINTGGGTLNGVTAITTNATGVASFTNLSITGSVGSRALRFASGTLPNVLSNAINVTTGPGTLLAFTTPPSTSANSGTPLAVQPVIQLQDAGGNPVSTAGVVVTATITTGTGSLTGATATSAANGSVTFAGLTISGSAGSFVLQFDASGYTPLSSGTITVSTGPNTLITKAGTRVSVDVAGSTAPAIAPVFVARDGAGAPLTNKPVLVTVAGRCRVLDGQQLPQTQFTMQTDPNGEVHPSMQLPLGATGAGCVVRATGTTFTAATDSALLAVYPINSTHIWVGGAGTAWSTASSWYSPNNTPATAAPGATDQAFVPSYTGIANFPTLTVAATVRKLALDTGAAVNINQTLLSIGNLGVTGLGIVFNGTTVLTATSTNSGSFDKLVVGQVGACAGMMATLAFTTSNTLDLYCAAQIDTTAMSVGTDLVVHPNGGALTLPSARSAIIVGGNALFTGDSLYSQNGSIAIQGNATFAGNKVILTGGIYNVIGTVAFQAASATYSAITMSVGGNVTVGGTGTTGTQLFSGGTLSLSASFTQLAGAVPGTFITNNDQVTQFAGAFTQTISFANTSSYFSVLQLFNSSAGGVVILDRASTINATTQPRVDLISGKLTLDTNAVFFGNGNVVLGSGVTLNLLGGSNFQVSSGVCSGRTTNGAFITGTGNFNGAPYTPATCTP